MGISSQMAMEEAVREAPPNTVEAAARVLRAGKSPAKAAFAARALNALARLTAELDDWSLSDASGAVSDLSVLVRALEDPHALSALRQEDPLAPAKLRGLLNRERLMEAAGGTATAEQVASLLKITRQAVDKRRRQGHLIGLSTGRHGYSYPLCQFDPQTGVLPHLEAVLNELREHDPWMQLTFLLNPNTRLGGESPLAELRRGHVEAVKRAARMYGEQGAA